MPDTPDARSLQDADAVVARQMWRRQGECEDTAVVAVTMPPRPVDSADEARPEQGPWTPTPAGTHQVPGAPD